MIRDFIIWLKTGEENGLLQCMISEREENCEEFVDKLLSLPNVEAIQPVRRGNESHLEFIEATSKYNKEKPI